jgi:hypothetical protein
VQSLSVSFPGPVWHHLPESPPTRQSIHAESYLATQKSIKWTCAILVREYMDGKLPRFRLPSLNNFVGALELVWLSLGVALLLMTNSAL